MRKLRPVRPVTRALLIINVLVYGVQLLLGRLMDTHFALWPPQGEQYGFPPFHPWQLLTYGFLHLVHNPAHLAFNMVGLYVFGPRVERLFGSTRYLIYYLGCMLGAALMHLIIVFAFGKPLTALVGASSAVYGLLLVYGMVSPRRIVTLGFAPISMPAWLLVTLFGVLELVMGVTQTPSGATHFAHLGGMVSGFVMIRHGRAQRRKSH